MGAQPSCCESDSSGVSKYNTEPETKVEVIPPTIPKPMYHEFRNLNKLDFFRLQKNRFLACFLVNACNFDRKDIIHDALKKRWLEYKLEDIGQIGWRITIQNGTTFRYFIFKSFPQNDPQEVLQPYFSNTTCSIYAGFNVPGGVQRYFERAKTEMGSMWTENYHKDTIFLCGHSLGATCALFLKYDGTFRCKPDTECVVFAPLFYTGIEDVNTDIILGESDESYQVLNEVKPCFVHRVGLSSRSFSDYCDFFERNNNPVDKDRKTSIFHVDMNNVDK